MYNLVQLISTEAFSVESNGRTLAQRVQIPLSLAWAITVHKCQGMTLDAAVICFDRCFEYGQV